VDQIGVGSCVNSAGHTHFVSRCRSVRAKNIHTNQFEACVSTLLTLEDPSDWAAMVESVRRPSTNSEGRQDRTLWAANVGALLDNASEVRRHWSVRISDATTVRSRAPSTLVIIALGDARDCGRRSTFLSAGPVHPAAVERRLLAHSVLDQFGGKLWVLSMNAFD